MKNIRSYLQSNKYTQTINSKHYKYIMNKVYQLSFKKDIDIIIDNEIKVIYKKDKFYKDFYTYFNRQWSPYFKNKTLMLNGMETKFRTNNSIENFNRIFKNIMNKNTDLELIKYVDKLIDISKDQKEFFKDNINTQIPTISKTNYVDYNKDFETIMKEIAENDESLKMHYKIEVSQNSDNENNSNNLINNIELKEIKGFLNYNRSCSFDSFISIFIFSIKPFLENNVDILNDYKFEENKESKFPLYIKFIETIEKDITKNYIYFYTIYDKFNKKNKCNLFELDKTELHKVVPIVLNYRNFNNNKLFGIIYKIKHYCSGKCKFSRQLVETFISKSFIEIPLIAYDDERIKSVTDLFKEYIYININTICKENECYKEDDDSVINFYVKTYEIINLPLVLAININLVSYDSLLEKKDLLIKFLKKKLFFTIKNID